MDVQDLLKNPQLFAVKKDGILQMRGGLSDDKFALKCGYLMAVHHVVGCNDPDCDCIDRAWGTARGDKPRIAIYSPEASPSAATRACAN